MTGTPLWFALKINANAEYRTHDRLIEAGFHSFFPHFLREVRVNGRRGKPKETYIKREPIIEGYALAAHDGTDVWWHRLKALEWPRSGKPVVQSVVGMGRRAVPVPYGQFLRLMQMSGHSEDDLLRTKQMPPKFSVDDTVKLIEGPFAGIPIPITQVDGARMKALLKVFGAEREIAITAEIVEAA